MANMRMMTATALAALLAMGAAPAAMADTNATIELDAASGGALDGHTYTAYRIGTYGNVERTGGKVTRVDVTNDAESKTWLAAALKLADVDRVKGCDEAGTIAHLTDATKTRSVARALAKAGTKPTEAAHVTGSGVTATLSVPEGLYLVVDSDGQPIIVGTKIDGLDLASQTLGVANVKVWGVPVTLTVEGDAKSTNVGDTRTFHAAFTAPAGDPGALMLSIGGQGVGTVSTATATCGSDTATLTVSDGTVDLTQFAKAHKGRKIDVSYNAGISQSGPTGSDAARSDATLTVDWGDGITKTSTGTVRLLSFRFGLDKVSAGDTTQHLSGAGFKVQGPDGWLVKGGMGWTFSKDESGATEFTTGDDGLLKFEGLKAGTYTLKETTVPDGFWSIAKPTLTVAISDDGIAVIKGVDEPNLTQQVIGTGDMDGWTVAQVRNVNGVSQLPSTGGVGTALTVAAALSAAAVLLALSIELRRLSAR